eukprot:323651-Chlamydomonas_euryale.AAC.4
MPGGGTFRAGRANMVAGGMQVCAFRHVSGLLWHFACALQAATWHCLKVRNVHTSCKFVTALHKQREHLPGMRGAQLCWIDTLRQEH